LNIVEGDWRAGRLRLRNSRLDRISLPPGTAISVFDFASAVGGGKLYRGLRCAGTRAGAHREAMGEHPFLEKRAGLLGFDIGGKTTPESETPITPIIIGDGKLTMDFSRELFKEGVLGTGIAFPTVPEGKARIRTIMSATHTQEELQKALEVLSRVGKRMAIL